MASAAKVVRAALVQLGVVRDDPGAWQATYDVLPAGDVDQAVCVMDSGSSMPTRFQRGNRVEYPKISVAVRSRTYDEGFDKAQEICQVFDMIGVAPEAGGIGQVGVALEDQYYVLTGITVTVTPVKISEEETNRRSVFILNARVRPPLNGVPIDVVWGTYNKTWGESTYPWNGVARLPVGMETAVQDWDLYAYNWNEAESPWGG